MRLSRRYAIYIKFIMLVLVLIITLASLVSLESFWDSRNSSRPEDIRKAVLDACVQCYALEGSYPPSLEYLEKHYGLILDREEYYFYYEVFASNVMPTVEVYKK
ncbi:MAG: hypothetical protein QM224_04095 [Bacillota bacterium]|jgi:CDP-diacylglycerol pyrophosphatase|nr:hypothetical protein [Bacillota bacterium]